MRYSSLRVCRDIDTEIHDLPPNVLSAQYTADIHRIIIIIIIIVRIRITTITRQAEAVAVATSATGCQRRVQVVCTTTWEAADWTTSRRHTARRYTASDATHSELRPRVYRGHTTPLTAEWRSENCSGLQRLALTTTGVLLRRRTRGMTR